MFGEWCIFLCIIILVYAVLLKKVFFIQLGIHRATRRYLLVLLVICTLLTQEELI